MGYKKEVPLLGQLKWDTILSRQQSSFSSKDIARIFYQAKTEYLGILVQFLLKINPPEPDKEPRVF